jgi:hypothetical protein
VQGPGDRFVRDDVLCPCVWPFGSLQNPAAGSVRIEAFTGQPMTVRRVPETRSVPLRSVPLRIVLCIRRRYHRRPSCGADARCARGVAGCWCPVAAVAALTPGSSERYIDRACLAWIKPIMTSAAWHGGHRQRSSGGFGYLSRPAAREALASGEISSRPFYGLSPNIGDGRFVTAMVVTHNRRDLLRWTLEGIYRHP